jgi:hypothetical protein
MDGFRIQIIKAKLDSYWYAGCTGNVYWAVLHEREDNHQDYKVIVEGIVPLEGLGAKWVDFDDCIVIKEAKIAIETAVNVKVIEL